MSKEQEIRLERRPEARSFTVERLLLAVRDGKIRIPEFQRPLRWKSSDVLDFFDSIHRGFPVGTLLLSRAPAPLKRLHFGAYSVEAKETTDALYVVDGQQRITALAAAILHPDLIPRDGIFAVWFDLENERFVRLTKSHAPPTWIPLNIAGNRKATSRWVTEWSLRSERSDLVDRVFGLNTNLESYEIPSYIVEQASEKALRTIFKRTNTSGVELKESEVFEALYGTSRVRPITSAIRRLHEQTKFGELDSEWFLRCLKAVEDIDPSRTFHDEGDGAGMEAAVEKTENALRQVLVFLIEDAGIPHIQLLPYRLPLIVLSRFFALHPQVDSRARRLLVRWVWRGALSGAHTNSNNVTIHDLQSRIDDDTYASIERLLKDTPKERRLIPYSRDVKWNGRAASTKLNVLALLHKFPRDRESEEPLTPGRMGELLDEHRELKKIVVELGPTNLPTLANRVLLARKDSVHALENATEVVLRSHLIDEKAVRDLRRGDIQAFVKKRAKLIDEWAGQFFAMQAGIGESDRPALAELARRVENMALSA
jgi:hypothetical protein